MVISSPILNTKTNTPRLKGTSVTAGTVKNLQQILIKKGKVRKEILDKKTQFTTQRREKDKRKRKEEELEASNLVVKPSGPIQMIQSSTKGFLERLLSSLAYLTAGWLMNNLPTWIAMGKEFIGRVQRMGQLIGGFMTNVKNIFTGFGNLLSATFQNLIQFDLFDSSNQVKDAFGQLTGSVDDMGRELEEAIRLITTPLTEGMVTGKDAPPTGQERTSEGAYEPAGPMRVSGGDSDFWTLVAVAAREDSDPQGRADVAQSIYNRLASGAYSGKTIKELILARTQYQPTWDYPKKGKYGVPNPEWSNIVDAQSAAKATGLPVAAINSAASSITNPTLQKNAAEFVGGRTDFKAYPVSGSNQRKSGDNYFGWEYGYKGKTVAPVPNFGTSISTSQPQITPGRGVTTSVRDEVNVSGRSGGTPSVGLSREEGAQYLARRGGGRRHAGIDIGTSGQRGYYVSFKQSGIVTYAKNNGRGYGNLVIIKSGNIEFYFAHLASILVKEGQPYNGETIGEIGNTGGSYPIHLHFEARPNGTSTNPKPYLNLLSIGRQLTGISGKPMSIPTPASIPQAQIESTQAQQRQQLAQQLAQERRGQTVIVQQPSEPEPQSVQYASGGSQAESLEIDEFTLVNNFIRNKLLLDLAYL